MFYLAGGETPFGEELFNHAIYVDAMQRAQKCSGSLWMDRFFLDFPKERSFFASIWFAVSWIKQLCRSAPCHFYFKRSNPKEAVGCLWEDFVQVVAPGMLGTGMGWVMAEVLGGFFLPLVSQWFLCAYQVTYFFCLWCFCVNYCYNGKKLHIFLFFFGSWTKRFLLLVWVVRNLLNNLKGFHDDVCRRKLRMCFFWWKRIFHLSAKQGRPAVLLQELRCKNTMVLYSTK